jgi:polyisoprenoid-binding protein YceI
MSIRSPRTVLALLLTLALFLAAAPAARAENYKIDGAHTSVGFSIRHAGISDILGGFAETSGAFTLDADAAKTSFEATIQAASINTLQPKRDDHLRSPDFFNVKQFPTITFKSTKVAATEGGYEVTGDLTLHGVTKPVTLKLTKNGEAEFPKGMQRVGFTTGLAIKRSDYGMTNMIGPVGDDVTLIISFEGIKQ